MKPEVNCNNCIHYGDQYGLGRCKAFPNGIPISIVSGEVAHDKPFDNDNGIRFTPAGNDKIVKQKSLNKGVLAIRKTKTNV